MVGLHGAGRFAMHKAIGILAMLSENRKRNESEQLENRSVL